MSSKWFIPMSLGAFVLLVGGPWLYLSATQESSQRSAARRSTDILRDPAFVGLAERTTPPPETSPLSRLPIALRSQEADSLTTDREAPDVRQQAAASNVALRGPSRSSVAPAARVSPTEMVALFAERLDDASVKLRSDLDKTVVTQFARGASAAQQGRHEEALIRFEEAIRRDPQNVAAHSARASSLIAMGRFDEASEACADVVRLSPKDAAARYNYAVVLFRLALYYEAAVQLRETVVLDPDHAAAYHNLASIAQREGRLREARDAWEHFTRLRPDVANAWFNLGVVYVDMDQPIEAAVCFAAVTELAPDDADAFVNLGIARALAGEYEQALTAMQRADALDPCDETITRYLVALHDLVADFGGPGAVEHRQMAAMLQEQVENTWIAP